MTQQTKRALGTVLSALLLTIAAPRAAQAWWPNPIEWLVGKTRVQDVKVELFNAYRNILLDTIVHDAPEYFTDLIVNVANQASLAEVTSAERAMICAASKGQYSFTLKVSPCQSGRQRVQSDFGFQEQLCRSGTGADYGEVCITSDAQGRWHWTDGPSIPPAADTALHLALLDPNVQRYAVLFWPAGVRHDNCYHHNSATYGKTRSDCDAEFGDIMLRICNLEFGSVLSWYSKNRCQTAASVMESAVRSFGASHYANTNTIVNYLGDGRKRVVEWAATGSVPDRAAATGRVATYDGDLRSDATIYRRSTGNWHVRTSHGSPFAVGWGLPTDTPVVGDFDGDRKTDPAIYRASDGSWHIRPSSGAAPFAVFWGAVGDIPVPGDYDSDGITDAAIYRQDGFWHLRLSSTNSGAYVQWGLPGDVPVPGDYDGDNSNDMAIFRPSTGYWHVRPSSGLPPWAEQWTFGFSSRVATGDFDGDNASDLAVYVSGVWHVKPSSGATPLTVAWGLFDDLPILGDFDGDRRSDFVVYRPTTGEWFVRPASGTADSAFPWGLIADVPVPVGGWALRRQGTPR